MESSSAMDVGQMLLTAFDTSMSKYWREEDRRWRAEDRTWRDDDLSYREEERQWRVHEKIMREAEIKFVEKNRRDVEEKSEQLKAISNLAALFAGFAVVTLTQFSFQQHEVSIVGLMTIAMVTCTLILGSILKNGKSYVNEVAEEDFMFKCHTFVESYQIGDRPPFPRRTFENFWDIRCEDDWRRAFQLYALGVLSFLVSLIPIGWIKFYYSPVTAYLFIGVTIVSITVWLLVQYFWGGYLSSSSSKRNEVLAESVQPVGLPFDWHLAPGVPPTQQS